MSSVCFDWSHVFVYPSFPIFFCSTGFSYNVSCSENALLFFFYLFLSGFPILWHASFLKTLTSISESTEINVSSKSLSETCPEIPETTILFLLPYCCNALTANSLDTTSFFSLLHFSRNCLFSSCSLLMTMSLRFIISSLRQFMVEIMFSSTLADASLPQLPPS